MRYALILAALFWTTPVASQDAANVARQAQADLVAAMDALDAAPRGRDRVIALTAIIRSFEDALAAVRDSLRGAATQEQTLQRALDAREAEVAELLGALQVLSRSPGTTVLLHPSGPAGAARSGMLLADVTPAIQSEVRHLRGELREISDLRSLQDQARQTLEDGLVAVQEARAALSNAISDRTPLPQRFTEDPVQTALLIGASETLEGFATALADQTITGAPNAIRAEDLRGRAPLPAFGTILRRPGEADAAGIRRPGLLLATEGEALVVSPLAATIRYQGPLLDYGNVIILEPARDTLMVLGGLDSVYVPIGAIVSAGEPLGVMPQDTSDGSLRAQTLYIEMREAGEAVDPLDWFDQN